MTGFFSGPSIRPNERAIVIADDGVEHLLAERILKELPRLRPQLFSYGGRLVCVDSKGREQRILDTDGNITLAVHPSIRRLVQLALMTELSRRLQFLKSGPSGRGLRAINVPYAPVAAALTYKPLPVPLLAGLISTPTMRRDGTLLTEKGFDDATGFYLDHDLQISVPETPTKAEATAALHILKELTQNFPMDDMSVVVCIATMMGAVLRPAFPTMPGLVIDAPMAGSGKSHMAKTISYLAHGRLPVAASWPKGPEFDKQLGAMLVGGDQFLAFDNCNGVEITGDLLCSMLTEPEVSIRILGSTEVVEVATAGLVLVINGNHPHIAEDATQRFITCYINPDQANPRERVFTSDPIELLKADRGRYVSAVLTIARAYIAAGKPGAVGYGSFDGWSRLVRSSLIWLTGNDVLATTRAAAAEDPHLSSINRVLDLIMEAVGVGVKFTVAEMVAAVQRVNVSNVAMLAGLVGIEAGGSMPANGRIKERVGLFFARRMRDRVVAHDAGAVRLKRIGQDRTGLAHWMVERVSG